MAQETLNDFSDAQAVVSGLVVSVVAVAGVVLAWAILEKVYNSLPAEAIQTLRDTIPPGVLTETREFMQKQTQNTILYVEERLRQIEAAARESATPIDDAALTFAKVPIYKMIEHLKENGYVVSDPVMDGIDPNPTLYPVPDDPAMDDPLEEPEFDV